MANWYVWSGAGGAGTGADWTNAYVRLRLATAAKAAGDTFFVAHDHAETEAATMTVVSPGTEAAPCRIFCVNRAGSVPPVSADLRTTATLTTTGAFGITLQGSVSECNGIIFNCGTGSTSLNISVGNTTTRTWRLVNCQLKCVNTGTNSRIALGSVGSCTILENTTMSFAHVSQGIQTFGRVIWRNTPAALAGSVPSTLFIPTGTSDTTFIEGVDLSAATGQFVGASVGASTSWVLKDCKYNSALTTTTTGWGSAEITLIRCDNGDTNYRNERHLFSGVQTTETTIVRTGGATDGTTPIAWKIVTTANAEKELPFESLPISIWNETLAPITITVQGIWGGGAVPNNDDIWIEVEYLATSGTCRASKATSGKADSLATGVAIPAGSGTWGGSTTKFAMAVTITPAEKGTISIYVKAGAVSGTFYVDPKPVVT